MESITIFCDGGSRGNPGPAASAFVAEQSDKVVEKESRFLGVTTNNVAEYTAVNMALEWLFKNQKKYATAKIILDSELVTKQISGEYKIKSQKLAPLAVSAKKLLNNISTQVLFEWSPRSGNYKSDSLVNEELDKNT